METENWYREISELEEFFEAWPIPVAPVRLNDWTLITDPARFISGHIATVRANNGNPTFHAYLERLQELKRILSEEKTCNERTAA